MSANWSMRSYGAPYFCLRQTNLAGMDANGLRSALFFGRGPNTMTVDFRVFTLPVQHSSPDELHAIMSVSTFLVGTRMMLVGITPSGKVGAAVLPESGGPVVLTNAGAVSPNGGDYRLEATYISDMGDLMLLLYRGGVLVGSAAVSAYAGIPLQGLMQVMMFNDPYGLARNDIAVSGASLSFADETGTLGTISYQFNEKSGSAIGEQRAAGSYPQVESFDLSAEYFPLLRAQPWGPPNAGTPGNEAYGWMVKTIHTEATPRPTRHTEVTLT